MGILTILKRFNSSDGRQKYLGRPAVFIEGDTHGLQSDDTDYNALRVVRGLQARGYKAYLVGGCVRDLLIGRKPKDFDVVTDAVPAAIKKVFPKARIIGRRFRIVHIPFGPQIIETATFRALPLSNNEEDGDLLIKRDNIYGTEQEDAVRRDFTINALFYDPVSNRIIDYVGGFEDIKRGTIRIIGRAGISYQEDPVRMIRAIKFQATTGFSMERDTYRAIKQLAEHITRCAAARVMEEIYKIMRSGVSLKVFHSLTKCGLLKYLIPEVYEKLYPISQRKHVFEQSPLGRRLQILDDLVNRGRVFQNVLFLVVLFYDLVREEIERSDHPDSGHISNLYLTDISQRMGFSRRIKDQMVKVMVVQNRFLGHERRSRQYIQRFLFKEYFKNSLDFFEINCRVNGRGSDDLLYWIDLYKKNASKIRRSNDERKRNRPGGRSRSGDRRRGRRPPRKQQ